MAQRRALCLLRAVVGLIERSRAPRLRDHYREDALFVGETR
jgi:hypothetical protein